MYRAILYLIFIATYVGHAQDSPGNRPELLLEKTVKIKPLSESELSYEKGYNDFFINENLSKIYAENKNHRTKHEALANRIFKVVDVRPFESNGIKNYVIQLQDTIRNEAVYYKFNKFSESNKKYYFQVIDGIKYPKDFFCDFLTHIIDKNTDEHKLTASISEGLHVVKIKKGKTITYRMEVVTVEQVISMLPGVVLVFEDGRKLEKPQAEAVMGTNNNDNIVYIATFELTPAEMAILTQSRIVSGKISKFIKNYAEGEKFMEILKCLVRTDV
ncbi:hypothetical protein CHU92_01915 [Flavobacterium cyanobacteriorum]|uniref:Uncharacterized protein n=1 Tax=Flavobacterium cyanobacteriorum TaxID=2022802 RepID=A0A255ZVY9_9FLAO|nr:hypothetical protein [Flavobacterium cyanobacteriorum]OYQ45562.1 hypothetical protein CHU92_01915 [Flavobacterium cyanobacteriorum]